MLQWYLFEGIFSSKASRKFVPFLISIDGYNRVIVFQIHTMNINTISMDFYLAKQRHICSLNCDITLDYKNLEIFLMLQIGGVALLCIFIKYVSR